MKTNLNKIGFCLFTFLIYFISPVHAESIQPARDGTGTRVDINGNVYNIRGGTLSPDGRNLFQSFSQFSLNINEIANFLTNPNIQNILGRVTGGNPSNINGLIQVTGGTSNLFLLNPAGVIFGSNASLNVPASFSVSTANGITFGNGTFNAFGNNNFAALTGNPTGFAFSPLNPSPIFNAGSLSVPDSQNLTLVGGSVISTGTLNAPNGTITVAAVPGENFVRLSESGQVLSLDLPLSTAPGDLSPTSFSPLSLPALLTQRPDNIAGQAIVTPEGTVQLVRSGTTVNSGDTVVERLTSGSAVISATNTLTLPSGQFYAADDISLNANLIRLFDDVNQALNIQAGGSLSIQGNDSLSIEALNHPSSNLVSGGDLFLKSANTVLADARFVTGGNFSVQQLNGAPGNLFSPKDPNIFSVGNVSFGDYTGGSLIVFAGGSVTFGNINITGFDPSSVVFTAPISNETQIMVNGRTQPTLFIAAGINLNDPQVVNTLSSFGISASNTVIPPGSISPTFGSPSGSSITTGNIRISAPNGLVFLTNQLFKNTALANGDITTGSIDTSSNSGSGGSVVIDSRRAINVNLDQINTGGLSNGTSTLLASFSQSDFTPSSGIGSDPFFLDLSTARSGNQLAPNDDGSTNEIPLGFSFTFFGRTYNSVYVNNNGNVTFTGPFGQFTPSNISSLLLPFIGVYFSDVDTRNRAVTSPGTNLVYYTTRTIPGPTPGTTVQQFVVTYDQVGYFSNNNSLTGTFQLAFDQLGRIGFAYNDVQFETGDASGGVNGFGGRPAAIGISSGLGLLNTLTLNSGTASIVYDRSLTNGISGTLDFSQILLGSNVRNPVFASGGAGTLRPPVDPIDQTTIVTDFQGHPQPDSSRRSGSRFANPLSESIATNTEARVSTLEDSFSQEFDNYFGSNTGSPKSLEEIKGILQGVEKDLGVKPALVYVSFVPSTASLNSNQILQITPSQPTDELELIVVTAGKGLPIRRRLGKVTRSEVEKLATEFRQRASIRGRTNSTSYLPAAQQLYQWLVAPIEADLEAQGVNNLSFISTSGLRSVPIAALHDGKEFLVQKYSLGLMPSMALTDNRRSDFKDAKILGLGISESNDGQVALPAVTSELDTIVKQLWSGSTLLNADVTPENLIKARKQTPYKILHLATHGEFKAGKLDKSYIQFWQKKLGIDQVRNLGLADNPPVDLLTFSACKTALGDREAELGFAGMAVAAGVKTSIASLWYVDDVATSALMSEFYYFLKQGATKSEALRQAQSALASGKIKLTDGQLEGLDYADSLKIPGREADSQEYTHPNYWAGFSVIGNPW